MWIRPSFDPEPRSLCFALEATKQHTSRCLARRVVVWAEPLAQEKSIHGEVLYSNRGAIADGMVGWDCAWSWSWPWHQLKARMRTGNAQCRAASRKVWLALLGDEGTSRNSRGPTRLCDGIITCTALRGKALHCTADCHHRPCITSAWDANVRIMSCENGC